MDLNFTFRNQEQASFFWHTQRNGLFDGGFNNGKSYVGCQRALIHLLTFSNYGMIVGRQTFKTLKATTMKTFFKLCPSNLIHTHDHINGYTVLVNGSFIYWMHLDSMDEADLRGLEYNSCLLDQAEEIQENIYNVLDYRVGRWDKAKVPHWLLRTQLSLKDQAEAKDLELAGANNTLNTFIEKNSQWPRHPKWGHFLIPNYIDCLCNPSDEDEFHWTYRYYNPISVECRKDHFYIHRASDESLTDIRSYQQALLRDPEWVTKYVHGLTGSPKAMIHSLDKLSIINPEDYDDKEFQKLLDTIKTKAALYRILDHGDTGVTCCLWFAAYNNIHICYREYYITSTLVSVNRQNIHDLSLLDGDPYEYFNDLADPSIGKKTQQSVSGIKAGFTSILDEYLDTDIIEAPPIAWALADNNEMATRNRINEHLLLSLRYMHPISRISPAPALYFIKKTIKYPFGCEKAIVQLQQQKKQLIGTDNGKNIYSDERDERIPDHAYDCSRYYVAAHNAGRTELKKKPPRMSMAYYNHILKTRPRRQREDSYAD